MVPAQKSPTCCRPGNVIWLMNGSRGNQFVVAPIQSLTNGPIF